jgi:hypothetical protein
MKTRIFKILGVAVTVAMVLTLAAAFSAPAAGAETINEWYKFSYPDPGEDGDWFYDPGIDAIGPMAEAINGDVYAAIGIHACLRTWNFDEAVADYSAVWSTEEAYSGIGSAKLTCTLGPDIAMAMVPFTCPLADVSRYDLGFSYYIVDAGNCPSFLLGIDTDGDYMVDRLLILDHCPQSSSIGTWHTDDGLGSWSAWTTAGYDPKTGQYDPTVIAWGAGGWHSLNYWKGLYTNANVLFVAAWLSSTGAYVGTAYVDNIMVNDTCFDLEPGRLFKSTDDAHTWEVTGYEDVDVYETDTDVYSHPGPIRDMVCSSIDEDVAYATDGNFVYKTDDGGDTWDFLARDSLETRLEGECGCCVDDCAITSIDVAYDADDNPFVFIGTRVHTGDDLTDNPTDSCDEDQIYPGDVLYIGEAGYPANWTSLNLPCFHGGGYDALAVGCAPDWADTKETYVVVTTDDDGDDHNSHTWVVYTKGTVCGWYEFAELLWDCDSDNYDDILLASRIGFPDDWEDTETLFVGVVDDWGNCPSGLSGGDMGDVYMATDGDALDMNVAGITTGCQGKEAVNILSLDVCGDTDSAALIAGEFCNTNVWYSTDGGWSWDDSNKDPTGQGLTYVIWHGDCAETALAATAGCECAVSKTCTSDDVEDVGESWNQISLIATSIDVVRFLGFSPGYVCEDTDTMFMVTYSGENCCNDTNSVWRYDGEYWERVFLAEGTRHDYGGYGAHSNESWMLGVSPDFNTTNCVYIANDDFDMFRTTDAGCSWDELSFPCAPRPELWVMEVIDEDTVIAGVYDYDDGAYEVWKTDRHGARPWKEYDLPTDVCEPVDLALEPGYEDPGSILLGDECSNVCISEDGGETWDLVGDFYTDVMDTSTYATWVVFDPGYATNHIIYAAAGNCVARCVIDPDEDWADQEWEVMCCDIMPRTFWGIAAVGDTALYVVDSDEAVYDGDDIEDGGVLRSLNPDADDVDDVVFERIGPGLDSGANPQLRRLWITCDTSDDGCAENVLWSLERVYADSENVWVYEDTLAVPVVLNLPVDEQKLTKTTEATLSWNELCGADCYEVALWSYCAECPDEKLDVDLCLECIPNAYILECAPEAMFCYGYEGCCWGIYEDDKYIGECCPCTSDTCIVVDGLEPGTTYYWKVRVCQGKPTLSKWSEERSFTTALLPVPFADLCSPACGSQDIILTPNFAWGAVSGATGYEVQLSPTETFTAGVIKGKTTVNAWVCPETLEYATTYYWRVRAEKDSIYSDWTYCMFTTMSEPVAPTPPVVVEQVPPSPAPVINIPPTKMITPTWIYAIIGVGAALAIVVIVLIVRTRRPPA